MPRNSRPDFRLLGIVAISLAAITALAAYGRIPQPTGYHDFADQRACGGIPNAGDSLSNLPFFIVGIVGLFGLRRGVPRGGLATLRPAYAVFFAASALLLPGSGYYHLRPTDAALAWDRLPMAVAFMAFFAVVIGEHIQPRLAVWCLAPLITFGILSVVYWRLTDTGSGGDLRLYVLVQYLPMLLIPFIALTYPSALRPVSYLWVLLGSYGLAKALEFLDRPILAATHVVSGHSLKHVVAALGIATFAAGLYRRRSRTEESA